MTAAQTLSMVADVLRVRFPGWTVVEGPAHNPIDHGLEVVWEGGEVVGSGPSPTVRDQILIRLAVRTTYDYATVLAAVDTLLLAGVQIAAEAHVRGGRASSLSVGGIGVVDDDQTRLHWYVEAKVWVERRVDEQTMAALESIIHACGGLM